MPHAPHPINIDLAKLTPDVIKLFAEIVKALNKRSDGGAKITPAEWQNIGEAAGFVARDIISDVTHK